MGMDYNSDGKISPFGAPDDALGSTARYLVERGKYRRGEHWGYEVRAPHEARGGSRSYAEWQEARRDARRRRGFPATRRHGAPMGAGAGRAGLSGRREFLCGEELQPVDELRARALSSRRQMRRAAHPSCRNSRAANARRRSPKSRKSSAGSPRSATIPAAPTAASATTPRRGAQYPAQDRHGAGRRLCRRGTSRPVASRLMIRLDAAHTPASAQNNPKERPHMTPPQSATAAPSQRRRPGGRRARTPDAGRRQCAGLRQRRHRRRAALARHPLYRAHPRRELSRAARQHRQLSRQCDAADAALPARGSRRRDRARLRQGHRQGDGRGGALQCRTDARLDGDVQRLVRPHAGRRARRHRPGRRRQAPAVDRLDPHRARSGRAGSRIHQMGRPAGVARPPRAKRSCAAPGSPTPRRRARSTSISMPSCRRRKSPSRCRRSTSRATCRRSRPRRRPNRSSKRRPCSRAPSRCSSSPAALRAARRRGTHASRSPRRSMRASSPI